MESSLCIDFPNNQLLVRLVGGNNEYLLRLEKELQVKISMRGNRVAISGEEANVDQTRKLLNYLYNKLEQGGDVSSSDVDASIRRANIKLGKIVEDINAQENLEMVIKTINKLITPYSSKQKLYVNLLHEKEMVFAEGPAGTGKTYLSVAVAVSMFLNHRVERIILARPAVEAGEKIGFLPGDMKEKVDPYMQPLYDALHDMMPADKIQKNLANGIFEIAPLGFMRGRTLKNSFIILDEAQNATTTQMKMFLTRLGEGSRMVISGDLTQIDLPKIVPSGLSEALDKLKNIEEIGFIKFNNNDIIRHKLVAKIVEAYGA